MTDIVIIGATAAELAPFSDLTTLESGMGATNTAIATLRAIKKFSPRVIIQVGICGAIEKSLYLCEPVLIESDFQGDLGAWRGEKFEFFANEPIYCPLASDFDFRKVRGVSVNAACTPSAYRGDAQVESMEGAAFFAAANSLKVDFLQLRTVSNFVGQPRGQWKINEAIEALRPALEKILDKFRPQ